MAPQGFAIMGSWSKKSFAYHQGKAKQDFSSSFRGNGPLSHIGSLNSFFPLGAAHKGSKRPFQMCWKAAHQLRKRLSSYLEFLSLQVTLSPVGEQISNQGQLKLTNSWMMVTKFVV